jgi:hypothetical protein
MLTKIVKLHATNNTMVAVFDGWDWHYFSRNKYGSLALAIEASNKFKISAIIGPPFLETVAIF